MGTVSFPTKLRTSARRKKNNLILCTVGDHRSNEVVERIIFTVKAKLMARLFRESKPTLNAAIGKVI